MEEKLYVRRIGLTGTLTQQEKEIVKDVFARRDHQNRTNNVVDRKMSVRTSQEINYDGFGAEVIFGRWFGLKVDTTDYCRGGKSDTGDFVLPNGKIIDVKNRPGGRFMVPEWKKKGRKFDYYAYITGGFDLGYEFRGFLTWETVFDPKNLTMVKVMSFVVNSSELKELADLESASGETR
jgi:hypothetical protein